MPLEVFLAIVIPWFTAGLIAVRIAERRGRDLETWLMLGFFLGLFALLAVVLAPGRPQKICPGCGEHVPREAEICSLCRYGFPPQTMNRPAGIPPWPGVGRKTRAPCLSCESVTRFDDEGVCLSCDRKSVVLRWFWGLEEIEPPKDLIERLRLIIPQRVQLEAAELSESACPHCGAGVIATDRICISCQKPLETEPANQPA